MSDQAVHPDLDAVPTLSTNGDGELDGAAAVRRLLVVSRSDVRTHALPATGTLVVGRSTDCAVALDDRRVSRHHLRLHAGAGIEVEDLESRHGTWLRGRRLHPGRRYPLKLGDILSLGGLNLVLQPAAADTAEPRLPAHPAEPLVVSSRMIDIYQRITRVAASDISVLVVGETGVGKEIVAEAIHRRSPRAGAPFVRLNCGALAPSLLESELFGHEKGAFTGADRTKPGLFESAHRGTIFLDEIGEIPPNVQIKLLRVLEERKVLRVGGLEARAIDVRLITATNRDLKHEIAAERFRRDLFYRINGITVDVPPLRARPDEIVPLAVRFLAEFARDLGRTPPVLSPAVADALVHHSWPGNVRELRNSMLRAVVLSPGGTIDLAELPNLLDDLEVVDGDAPPADDPTAHVARERQRIMAVLEELGGNQSRAAKRLGISRSGLIKRIKRYQIPRPRGGG